MTVLLYFIIGFAAQMIDGALGMAYGVTSRTLLQSVAKVPPVTASAIVHFSEIPATCVSGFSHIRYKNYNLKLLYKLAIPGVIGGATGAFFLSSYGETLEPFVCAYLIVMGVRIVAEGFSRQDTRFGLSGKLVVYPIAFAGGFLDAVGGGGWGPVLVSSLLAKGEDNKKIIGSVNISEFFVTAFEAMVFVATLGNLSSYLKTVGCLVAGNVVAAPIAAKLCLGINEKFLFLLVGGLIIALNVYNFIGYVM